MFDREDLMSRYRAMIARGEPIVGGGAGCGLSAKCEEAGGIDLIVIYNSGRYRMAGRGSLAGLMPYGDATPSLWRWRGEVIPVVKTTPVLAGVCASDPFRLMDRFLDEVKLAGFSGIQNFPTVGLIDGSFRANLEETGMSYSLEVDVVRMAREKGLLTTPYVFSAEDADAMAKAGADIIGLSPGADHRRIDRRGNGADPRAVSGAGRRMGVRRTRRQSRRHHSRPWRSRRHAGGRGLCPQEFKDLPWLLWRVIHGASADRDRAYRADAEVQAIGQP